MAKTFELPDPGEGIHEAEVVDLHVSAGDRVEESDILLDVETDKAVVEVPSPFTGTIREVMVDVGDDIRVGEGVLTYEEGEDSAEGGETEDEKTPQAADEEAADDEASQEEREAGGEEEPAEDTEPADEEQPDEEQPDDEESGKEAADEEGAEAGEEGPRGKAGDEGKRRPVPAAPATRRLARELDVDLRAVEATGPEGRVTAEDVRRAAGEEGASDEAVSEGEGVEEKEATEEETAAGGEAPAEEEAAAERPPRVGPRQEYEEPEEWGPVEREALRSVRRTTARRMADAWERIPHVTHVDHADITGLEAFRAEHDEALEEADLTLTVFLLKALVAVLKEFPRFNARLDEEAEEIALLRYYHLGVAVDTDRGLLVPVVRDVDAKSLKELAVEVGELAEAARGRGITRDQMRGGSFTLTNPGPLGGDVITPIINPPQVAILGVGRASKRAVVIEGDDDDRVETRLVLPLCLSFDHRVNDGADAARFTRRLAEILEDPDTFVRHL